MFDVADSEESQLQAMRSKYTSREGLGKGIKDTAQHFWKSWTWMQNGDLFFIQSTTELMKLSDSFLTFLNEILDLISKIK